MPRPESPCGTHAAYKRHKRRNEPVDDACREAAAEHVRAQRARAAERAAQNAAAVDESPAGGTVRQLVAYGEFEDVTVPEHEDPLDSARWRLRRARAAILVAGPRDMPALLTAERQAIEDIARLSVPAKESKKVSALDQLAEKRAQRLAEAAG